MTTLAPGKYHLRYVPRGIALPFVGGVYATFEQEGKPVLLEAQTPETASRQTWIVEKGADSRDEPSQILYTIKADTASVEKHHHQPTVLGFSHKNNVPTVGEMKVLLSTHLKEWYINENDDGTFIISSPVPTVGAEFCITELDSEELLIKSYPVEPSSLSKRPRWQFIPVKA